nr:hypothetical protein CFP56_55932 [Quercus suber]
MPTSIDQLPEEIVLLILNCLDSRPLSEINARGEPTKNLTVDLAQPLKQFSQVSKRWRRSTLPLLFKFTCLRFDTTRALQRTSCVVCDTQSGIPSPERNDALSRGTAYGKPLEHPSANAGLPGGIDRYHLDITRDAILETHAARDIKKTACPDEKAHYENMLMWPSVIYHDLRQLLDFLTEAGLQKRVQSVIILTEPMNLEVFDRFPDTMRQASNWRSIAIAAFWQHLFSKLNPTRVAIIAPPIELACITGCAIDTFGDWAFGDMDYHLLELRQVCQAEQVPSIDAMDYKTLASKPLHYPGIAAASVLRIRAWSDVSLNEASFLKAYGTYHFFERGPPSLVYSINDALFVRKSTTDMVIPPLASIETFRYTAILPFATHLDFVPLLSWIVTLDLQLAPLPESDILTDRLRVGRAELEDCWSELFSTYENLVKRIASWSISGRSCPKLRKFICRDMQIVALRADLDEIFTRLCLPVWGEFEPGVFTRLADNAVVTTEDAVQQGE